MGDEIGVSYQPIGDRARLARRLLVAAVVIYLLAVGAGVLERSVFARFAAGEEVTAGEVSFSDTCQLVVGVLLTLVLVVNAVTFIRWLSLAYRNLPALGVRRLRHQTWWAIGGWFIPILWLFRPKEIVNDVWRGVTRWRRRLRSGSGVRSRDCSSHGGPCGGSPTR